jgi:hypothetical protein
MVLSRRGNGIGRSSTRNIAADRVKQDIAGGERGAKCSSRPPKQRLDPGNRLGKRKRLDQVIVRARLEAADTILKRIPRGQDQDFRALHKLALNNRLQSGP